MKQTTLSGGKLRLLFCAVLAVTLAACVALSGTAVGAAPVPFDVKVDSSSTHTAFRSGSDVYFVGVNTMGQFPDSKLEYSPGPVKMVEHAADVAVSEDRTLVVTEDGLLRSYGIDPVSPTVVHRGVILGHNAAQVDASSTFAAYITDGGALYTWGLNDSGQLGNGTSEPSEKPVQIFESGVKKVSLGENFALALMEDGTVYGWGGNAFQELGYQKNGMVPRTVNEPVKILENVEDLAAGRSHSCFLKTDGTLWTCGDNSCSQTGVGGEALYSSLTQILSGIRSISAGSEHNFAVSLEGDVYAWGYGVSGQLGTGDGERADTPTLTSFDFVQVFACNDNTFGITADGSVFSFGDNTNYLLGKSERSDSLSPVRVLDKEMNWVYESTLPNDDYHFNENDPYAGDPAEEDPTEAPSEGTTPAENAPEAAAPEEVGPVEPEVVATPFVSGVGHGTFLPNKNVTRAEFLRMLVSALCTDFDEEGDYGTCSYSDIPVGKWFERYIAYAEMHDLINGYKDGTFRPNKSITRAEAAAMASTVVQYALKITDTQVFEESPDFNSSFDSGEVFKDVTSRHWAVNSIKFMSALGVINGDTNGKFRPGDNLSRAEAVTLVAQAAGFQPSAADKDVLRKQYPEAPFHDVDTGRYYYIYMLRGVGYVDSPNPVWPKTEPAE